MAIRIKHVGDVAIVIAAGDFMREPDVDKLSAAIAEIIDHDGCQKVLVNLSQTQRVNSMALGVLVAAATRALKVGGHVVICGMQRRIQDVVTTRCFPMPFKVFDSCDEALKALQEV